MGRSIWCKLPEELGERVFAFLPISEVFKCRLVCKQWNFILTSQSFNELWTNLSPPNPWFLVCRTSEEVVAYDPASSSWINIPVNQLCSLSQRVELMASAGGLLCFRTTDLKDSTLIVCNPLTKSRRFLPEMLQIRYIAFVGMAADKTTNSYRILVMGTTELPINGIITEVYDSTLGKWIHQCYHKKYWRYSVHAIWHEGVFYSLEKFIEEGYCRILKYDMERREWAELDVKMPSINIWCPSLISCGGRLLLAGKIVKDGSIRSICIWEVRMDSLEAVRIDAMPREVLSKFHIAYSQTLRCQGNNNLICFSTHPLRQFLLYDLSDKSWKFLPENRACMKMIGQKSFVGMSYDPNLAAKV